MIDDMSSKNNGAKWQQQNSPMFSSLCCLGAVVDLATDKKLVSTTYNGGVPQIKGRVQGFLLASAYNYSFPSGTNNVILLSQQKYLLIVELMFSADIIEYLLNTH